MCTVNCLSDDVGVHHDFILLKHSHFSVYDKKVLFLNRITNTIAMRGKLPIIKLIKCKNDI